MLVIKPNFDKSKNHHDLEEHDEFYNFSHGVVNVQGEITLCSIAVEDWGSFKATKLITCKACLDFIRHCKKYKGKT